LYYYGKLNIKLLNYLIEQTCPGWRAIDTHEEFHELLNNLARMARSFMAGAICLFSHG